MAAEKHTLANPNVLQMDEVRSLQDHHSPMSLRCPHCLQIGMFENALRRTMNYNKFVQHAANPQQKMVSEYCATLRVCPNESCKGLVLVVLRGAEVARAVPPQKLDFTPDGIPPMLVATLNEALSCHSAEAYRAAAMMVRRLMEEVCEVHGAAGTNLHQRLADLTNKVPLSIALLDGAKELKVLAMTRRT
jgi:Domain of unknown function (DUF4145)